jgi:hypothetical protein
MPGRPGTILRTGQPLQQFQANRPNPSCAAATSHFEQMRDLYRSRQGDHPPPCSDGYGTAPRPVADCRAIIALNAGASLDTDSPVSLKELPEDEQY